jgi:hypothetical protein
MPKYCVNKRPLAPVVKNTNGVWLEMRRKKSGKRKKVLNEVVGKNSLSSLTLLVFFKRKVNIYFSYYSTEHKTKQQINNSRWFISSN